MTNPDMLVLNEIRLAIAQQPNHVLQKINNTAEALRLFIRSNGPEAHMAMALVGAEMAAEVFQ